MCNIGWAVRAAVILAFWSLAWLGPAHAADRSAQSRFLDSCLKRVDIDRDKTAAKDCYTSDFVMMGPETHATKDHAIHGAEAVAAKLAMGGGDSSAWGSVRFWTVDEIESGNKIVRHMHWEAKHPHGTYAGFDGLPADMTLEDDVITIYTLSGGKIAKEFFAYDTLNFFMDLVQGDPERMAKALAAMKPMMDVMRNSGGIPVSPPPPAAQRVAPPQ
jgi:ketosteroid isomerase-like protein